MHDLECAQKPKSHFRETFAEVPKAEKKFYNKDGSISKIESAPGLISDFSSGKYESNKQSKGSKIPPEKRVAHEDYFRTMKDSKQSHLLQKAKNEKSMARTRFDQ